jgi:putative ABC transport system permease protein
MDLGDVVKPLHGLPGEGGHTHTELAYRIVGRMAETGTPWDRAVLVPIEGVWRIHHLADGHGQAAHADPADGTDTDHEPSGAIGPPWRAPPGVPGIVVKARTIADAYRLRAEYRTGQTLGVFPAEVLTRLFATLGDVRKILAAIAVATQGLVAAAIVLVSVVHLSQRRRQLAVLRALGAPRSAIFGLVWLQLLVVVACGVILGAVLGWIGARAFASWLSNASGIVGPVAWTWPDTGLVLGLLAVAAIMAVVPAVLAYRQPAAAALRH